MGLRCKRCGRAEHLKNGLMRGKQPARGKPLTMKVVAMLLYVSGHFLWGA